MSQKPLTAFDTAEANNDNKHTRPDTDPTGRFYIIEEHDGQEAVHPCTECLEAHFVRDWDRHYRRQH